MAQSRAKSGKLVRNISVTGATTARKVSAFSFTRMVTSMRACGQLISAMDRELTGKMKAQSYAENTLETGTRTRSMEEVPSFTRTVTGTMDTGSTDCHKEKVA